MGSALLLRVGQPRPRGSGDSAFPLPPGVAEGDYTSLESFAAHIQEVVLHLRDEGHLLSSVDQHYIECWWEAGYPLESVLAAILVCTNCTRAPSPKTRQSVAVHRSAPPPIAGPSTADTDSSGRSLSRFSVDVISCDMSSASA